MLQGPARRTGRPAGTSDLILASRVVMCEPPPLWSQPGRAGGYLLDPFLPLYLIAFPLWVPNRFHYLDQPGREEGPCREVPR